MAKSMTVPQKLRFYEKRRREDQDAIKHLREQLEQQRVSLTGKASEEYAIRWRAEQRAARAEDALFQAELLIGNLNVTVQHLVSAADRAEKLRRSKDQRVRDMDGNQMTPAAERQIRASDSEVPR